MAENLVRDKFTHLYAMSDAVDDDMDVEVTMLDPNDNTKVSSC